MTEIDDTIGHVDRLYRAITGREAPSSDAAYAPIPAEKDPLQHVQEQMDRLLQMLGDPTGTSRPARTTPTWTPPLSAWEGPTEVVVYLDLPGVTRSDLEVGVQDNVLTVSGRRPPPAANGHRARMSEHPLGPFRRSIVLPAGLRVGELSAHLKEGVLEIKIPRDATFTGTMRAVPVS